MPILGTIASSRKSASAGAYESIATLTGNGSSAISFTSIPSTYEHLQVRIFFREVSGTTGQSEWYLKFNGNNTGANYWRMRWYSRGASFVGQGGSVSSEGIWGTPSVRNGATDRWGCAIIDIHDYAGSTYKSARIFGLGWNDATSPSLGNAGGPFTSTSAISSIQIEGNMGAFATGSTFALYGIKGSA